MKPGDLVVLIPPGNIGFMHRYSAIFNLHGGKVHTVTKVTIFHLVNSSPNSLVEAKHGSSHSSFWEHTLKVIHTKKEKK